VAEFPRVRVDAGGVGLNVYLLGDPARPCVVLLHGMRDIALGLLPIAEHLSRHYHVLLADLRGHGASDRPGSYAMGAYVFDLHRIVSELGRPPLALFGHSLGGQIAVRFAALFPELTGAVVIVEGLGPPERPNLADSGAALRAEGERLLGTFSLPAVTRALPSLDFAAERLQVNNPRLGPARARELAAQATERDANGNLVWAFDPRVASVFMTTNESSRYWAGVGCPALLITGARAGEYWSRAVPGEVGWSGDYAPGELEARLAHFPDHEHQQFQNSGHMVHFDEPERLAEVTDDFLGRRYE
jgi:pimeloyl-ACP methyl ester carboxylesterase